MMDPKKKFILFRRADNFCSAPWNLLYVDPDGGIHTCTKGHLVASSLNQDVTDILKGPYFRDVRAAIVKDQITSNCARCISLENHGDGKKNYQHLRNMYNEMFVDQTIDYSDAGAFVLGAVDLHWSSVCDLKCVTCWAGQSSSIANEQGLPVRHTPTNTALELIDFITDNQNSLREVYLSGGEPTLIKYNLNLLQKLEKRPDLLIRVNSNMMWSQDNRIVEEILKFPNVLFTCSADNLGNRFEYIRRGARWNTFLDNLVYLKRFDNVEIRINSVFFVLSALDLSRVVDFFQTRYQVKNFTINQCGMGHTYYQCRNLDDLIKARVRDQLEHLKMKYTHDLNLVGSLNNCIQELDRPQEECYRSKLNDVDLQAGTNWIALFPELV